MGEGSSWRAGKKNAEQELAVLSVILLLCTRVDRSSIPVPGPGTAQNPPKALAVSKEEGGGKCIGNSSPTAEGWGGSWLDVSHRAGLGGGGQCFILGSWKTAELALGDSGSPKGSGRPGPL